MKIQQLLETTDTNEWTEEQQLEFVQQDRYAIKVIINAGIKPSEQVQLMAVTQDGYNIRSIIKAGIQPSEQVQLAAVTEYGTAIEYIIKAGIQPSEQVQLMAVTNNGIALQYIKEPSLRLQLAVVSADLEDFIHINNPSEILYRQFLTCPRILKYSLVLNPSINGCIEKWVKNPVSQRKWKKYCAAVNKYYELYPEEYEEDQQQWHRQFNKLIKSLLKELE